MTPDRRVTRRAMLAAAGLAAAGAGRRGDAAGEPPLRQTEVERKVIYHSPQTPGFTCWVGVWRAADGSLLAGFTQATGPLTGRHHARKDVLELLSWPPAGRPNYDMTGLDLANVYLRSTDRGTTWTPIASERFDSPMNGVSSSHNLSQPDGTVLRAVWGSYLPFYDVPQTGYVQRSTDLCRTWGPPEVYLDEKEFLSYPVRLRRLSDGRIALLGGAARRAPGRRTRVDFAPYMRPALVIGDRNGRNWSAPILLPAPGGPDIGGEEHDLAELANGDLLMLHRALVRGEKAECRLQTLLTRSGDTWKPGPTERQPLPHSGAPFLLMLKDGRVLNIASNGLWWKRAAGEPWKPIPGERPGYYPQAVQLDDGRVLCLYHRGGDDPYGAVDQHLGQLTFRIQP